MKLERISAAAQIELPNANPLNRNHRVSKMSAPVPERNKIPERIAIRPVPAKFCERSVCDTCDTREARSLTDLLLIPTSIAHAIALRIENHDNKHRPDIIRDGQ